MRLSDEALESLRRVLRELGFGKELEAASQADLEEFASFLLNLTAAAIKTREKLRAISVDVPPSSFPPEEDEPARQASLPGFGD
jgi:hypothetical protein